MTDRAAYIQGLRQLADILEAHPEVPLPYEGGRRTTAITIHFLHDDDPRAELATAARAIPCTWQKETSEPDPDGKWAAYFDLNGQLGGLHLKLTAYRDAVCTRVVTGLEDREVQEIVTPAVTRTIVKPVEVVEWDCGSLLAPAEALEAMAEGGGS